jgi:membrane protein implicated in regulation of membrane protease activity
LSSSPPNTSEASWLGAAIIVGGGMASIFGFAALVWRDLVTILALGFGITLALSVALFFINATLRSRVASLETDLAERLRQVSELTGMASNQAAANRAAIDAVLFAANGGGTQNPMPRRTSKKFEGDQ